MFKKKRWSQPLYCIMPIQVHYYLFGMFKHQEGFDLLINLKV